MQQLKKTALLLLLLLALGLSLFSYEHRQQQQYHSQVTGLAWQYCSSSQFAHCTEPLLLDWGQALRYCARLQWPGYQDWRLPNRVLNY